MIQSKAFFLVTTVFFHSRLMAHPLHQVIGDVYPTHSMHDDLDEAIAAAKFANDKKAAEYHVHTVQDPTNGAYVHVKDKMQDKPHFANVPVCRYTVTGKDFVASTTVTWNRGTAPACQAEPPEPPAG